MSTNEPSRERQTTATTLEATAPEEATEYDAEEQSRSTTPSTVGARETVILNPDHPPRLDTFHFSLRGPFLYAIFVIFCNVAVPCMIYYPTQIYTKISDEELIGIGSAALGVSSCFDAPIRVWRLTRHRVKYGPLYYPFVADPAFEPAGKNRLMKKMPRSWWHMDFMMHTYTIALFFFAIPLAVAPAIPLYSFFLFSFPMLVAPVGIIFALTLRSWRNLPFWMSSDPPKTPTKPAVYYFIEDTGAVDFKHGREWRKRCQARYAASPPFRDLMWWQTVLWTFGMAVFIGAVAAVDWTTTLDVGFGLCISMIFIWGIIWSLLSYWHAHRSLKRERIWWRDNYATLVVPNLIRRRDSDPIGPCGTGAGVEPPQSGPKFLHGRHRGYSVHAELEVPPAAAAGLGTGRAEEEPEMQEVPVSRAVTRDDAATSAARDSTVTVVDAEFVAPPGEPTKSVESDPEDVASRSGRLV
ncbi:hypothetical protein JCM8115_000642 [Rhodotorula mucilaginosa]|uniref:Uncharacterized protein n=1 Tax=Rhodotorula mucilaginosa TaxID=5537 RepID=A0A9P7B9T1_RHOMI|nr:hypothetical protein C6P46_003548 [Rhodotorula mucilaginosa]TKA54452.1 hypothetical protein B0A53_03145 [Rhodotorula sp. CCFEE 5036]